MKTRYHSNQSSNANAHELRLHQITQLFLNSFKSSEKPSSTIKAISHEETDDTSIISQDHQLSKQETQLESAFKSSSNYISAKS